MFDSMIKNPSHILSPAIILLLTPMQQQGSLPGAVVAPKTAAASVSPCIGVTILRGVAKADNASQKRTTGPEISGMACRASGNGSYELTAIAVAGREFVTNIR